MASEQELKNINPLQKEFQNLLEQDFKNRKLKEDIPIVQFFNLFNLFLISSNIPPTKITAIIRSIKSRPSRLPKNNTRAINIKLIILYECVFIF